MITSNYQVDGDIYSYADKFFCDSSDDKPSNADASGGLINGAILEETDTGKTYIFDKKANKWTEKSAGGGGGGSATLAGLTDVDISNPSDGQTLVYNASAGKWENGAVGGGVMAMHIVLRPEEQPCLDKTWQEIDTAFSSGVIIVLPVTNGDEEGRTRVQYRVYAVEEIVEGNGTEYYVRLLLDEEDSTSSYTFSCSSPNDYPVSE